MTNTEFYRGAINGGDCVSNAWELVKRNYGMYLGISVISIILSGCIPCISIFLTGPILGGIFYVVLRDMRGEPVEFGMMFKGFEKFVPLMVVGVVSSIPDIIAQVLRIGVQLGQVGLDNSRDSDFQFFQPSDPEFAIASGVLILIALIAFVFVIFACAWRVLLFFAIPLALEHDLDPIQAMKLSARAAFSNLGGLILLFILEFLIALLGLVMCLLGVFFISIPVIYVANAFAYRQVFPLIQQNFYAPPTAGGYGNNPGSGM